MKLGAWLPIGSVARLRAAGATILLPRLPSRSVSHYTGQMAALAGLARGADGDERP